MADVITPDGSVYRYDDGSAVWRHIPDVDTANAMGVDWNALEQVDEVPGYVAEDWPSVVSGPPPQERPAVREDVPGQQRPQLLGTPDGAVYLLGDDRYYHHIPNPATFAALGLDWNAIVWVGQLPEPPAGELGSQAPAPPPPPPAPEFGDADPLLSDDQVMFGVMQRYGEDVNIGAVQPPAQAWAELRDTLVYDLPYVGNHVRNRGNGMRDVRAADLWP